MPLELPGGPCGPGGPGGPGRPLKLEPVKYSRLAFELSITKDFNSHSFQRVAKARRSFTSCSLRSVPPICGQSYVAVRTDPAGNAEAPPSCIHDRPSPPRWQSRPLAAPEDREAQVGQEYREDRGDLGAGRNQSMHGNLGLSGEGKHGVTIMAKTDDEMDSGI